MPVVKLPRESLNCRNPEAYEPHTAVPDPVLEATAKVMEAAGNELTNLQDQAVKTATELKAALEKALVMTGALESLMLQVESLMMLAHRAKTGATPETRRLATNALIEATLSLEAPQIEGVTQ